LQIFYGKCRKNYPFKLIKILHLPHIVKNESDISIKTGWFGARANCFPFQNTHDRVVYKF
jgi:hypothetical protein